MASGSFSVRNLTPAIGAELEGVDLSLPLSAEQHEEIHGALIENLVIFFRNQTLTPEQHKTLGLRFGTLIFILPRWRFSKRIPRSLSLRRT